MLEVNHRKPYRGDHGIQFEPEPNAYDKYSAYQILLRADRGLPLGTDMKENPPKRMLKKQKAHPWEWAHRP